MFGKKIWRPVLVLWVYSCLLGYAADNCEQPVFNHEDSMQVLKLSNKQIALSILPEFGGKIVSIKDLNGFEYLSRSDRQYRRRSVKTKYSDTEFDGIDECFPTINECMIDGKMFGGVSKLADHGLLFNRKWSVIDSNGQSVKMAVGGNDLPFHLSRTITLNGSTIECKYCLKNTTSKPLSYMYVFHPLLKAVDGINIEIADNTKVKLMYSSNDFLGTPGTYSKWGDLKHQYKRIFKNGQYKTGSNQWYKYILPTPQSSTMRMSYPSGEAIALQYDRRFFPFLAVWASCGTAGGLEHIGLEPTTNDNDSLKECIDLGTARILRANAIISWHINIIVIPKETQN